MKYFRLQTPSKTLCLLLCIMERLKATLPSFSSQEKSISNSIPFLFRCGRAQTDASRPNAARRGRFMAGKGEKKKNLDVDFGLESIVSCCLRVFHPAVVSRGGFVALKWGKSPISGCGRQTFPLSEASIRAEEKTPNFSGGWRGRNGTGVKNWARIAQIL